MHHGTLTVHSLNGESFAVPESTGYQTYSGFLTVLDAGRDGAGGVVHDSNFASLRNSGLLGPFGETDRYHKHKRLLGDETYEITISIVNDEDVNLYRALLDAVALQGEPIPLAHGALAVNELACSTASFDEILDRAAALASDADGVKLTFETMACLIDGHQAEVSTPFPSRGKVFANLQSRWNRAVERSPSGDPERQRLSLDVETIRNALYTQGTGSNFRGNWTPQSRVVNRETPTPDTASEAVDSETANTTSETDATNDRQPAADGGTEPDAAGHAGGDLKHLQGFTGEFNYQFKTASETTRTAILALGLAAPYLNVGRAVARGPGTVSVEVLE